MHGTYNLIYIGIFIKKLFMRRIGVLFLIMLFCGLVSTKNVKSENIKYSKSIKTLLLQSKYHRHIVAAHETLYSISREYGVKVKVLREMNKLNENDILSVGTILKIPINKESLKTISNNSYQKPINQHLDTHATLINTAMEDYGKLNIALMLPLMASNPEHISKDSKQFLQFYEGFLLGLDSLRNLGLKIKLRTFDTENNLDKLKSIIEEVNNKNYDLIVGPIYMDNCRYILENLKNYNVPVVYPLSHMSGNMHIYPNFVQVNMSDEAFVVEGIKWIERQNNKGANIIYLQPNISENSIQMQMRKSVTEIPGSYSFNNYNYETFVEDFEPHLKDSVENLIVFPATTEEEMGKFLPLLTLIAETYNITIVGLPQWQLFTSIDMDNLYKLNTKILTYSYINPSTDKAKEFAQKFRISYGEEPSSLAYKAYDDALYFVNMSNKFGNRTLDMLWHNDEIMNFSLFKFRKVSVGAGYENRGLFIINYSSDYKIKISKFNMGY